MEHCATSLRTDRTKRGWPAARFLMAPAEHEVADEIGDASTSSQRSEATGRQILSRLTSTLPRCRSMSKAQVSALCAGDGCASEKAPTFAVRAARRRQSHLAAAIGLSLIEKGWRVLFYRTSDLVQRLQIARREFGLEAAIQRLDRYHLLILDDLVTLPKIRRRPPRCSSRSAHAMNVVPF